LRWLSWSSLVVAAGVTIDSLERAARHGGANIATIAFALTELFAAFCVSVAVDRAFSLGEKTFSEPD